MAVFSFHGHCLSNYFGFVGVGGSCCFVHWSYFVCFLCIGMGSVIRVNEKSPVAIKRKEHSPHNTGQFMYLTKKYIVSHVTWSTNPLGQTGAASVPAQHSSHSTIYYCRWPYWENTTNYLITNPHPTSSIVQLMFLTNLGSCLITWLAFPDLMWRTGFNAVFHVRGH